METHSSVKRKTAGIPLMSDTRWGSRGKTVGAFLDHFKSAHSALTDLESRTSSNSNKANNLRHSMESFDTIVTAVTTNKILGYIQPLTKELQSPNIDLMTAYKEAREVAQVISTLRNEKGFCDIYAQSIELASTIDVVSSKKRVTNRQQNRANTPSQSIEEHYRLNLFYPFIDHVTSQLNTRFVENSEPAMLATYLIPSALSRLTKDKQEMMVSWYREDLPQPDSIDQEIHRWKVKNQPPTLLVLTAKDTLNMINVQYYPNIHCILSIYLTLPMTTCSCERSFSALRRLKTWLRSSIGNDRLSGLAMMHVHRNRALDPEKVLKRWDASGHRRIVLAFDRK
ncbi:52 kDa repressor of the inhibitor of the protein kinase [Dissostichus eleginoides]|uniref:52 kDa repressor of the inhibitor of the protein kinase n=1 Tax=Dissostichus eleginoides TaxID=100907 RepID=A0AAD9BSF4_DISEL|nr:52 kDa repressor of the inhibitor of the protein kinase [Dissostichus eleginoides]